MNRKEALEHFHKEIGIEAVEQQKQVFYEDFKKNKNQFCNDIRAGLEQMIEELVSHSPEKQVAVIRFAYIQAAVLGGRYTWQLIAQDKNEYLDKDSIQMELDLSVYFQSIEQMEDTLVKESRKYLENMYEGDVLKYKLQAFQNCLPVLYLACSQALVDFRETEAYGELCKERVFRIVLCGYMDQEQIVFLDTEEDLEKAKEKLYLQGDAAQLKEVDFIYRNYSGIVLKEEEKRIDCKKLLFTCFSKSRIRYHQFKFCNMIGASFRNSRIDDTGFVGNPMQQVDFTGATLCNCDMHASMFYGGEFVEGQITPGIYEASFRNAKLENVYFSLCDLRNCDFTGAQMIDVHMEDAKLAGAKINKEYREILALTKQQEEEVDWV